MAAAHATGPPADVEAETSFRGLEKIYCQPNTFYNVISAFHFEADPAAVALLESNAPRAIREVFTRHPRCRAHHRIDADGSGKSVQLVVLRDAPATESCWRVLRDADWRIVAANAAETPMDRTSGGLWDITLVLAPPQHDLVVGPGGLPAPPAAGTIPGSPSPRVAGTLILRNDHSVGDGYSTFRVAADFFAACTRDVATTAPAARRPLAVSGYDAALGPGGGSCIGRSLAWLLMPIVTSTVIGTYKAYRPLLPLDPTLPLFQRQPFPYARTRYLWARGDVAAAAAALARARAERTTMHGAFLAALACAYSRVAATTAASGGRAVRFALDFDYNFRGRHAPLGPDDVGYYIGISTLALTAAGLPMAGGFWDAARRSKAATTATMASLEAGLVLRYCDAHWSSADVARDLGNKAGGIINDLNFSNLGRYPGPETVTFPPAAAAGAGSPSPGPSLRLTGHNLANSNAGPTSSMLIFCTAVGGAPGYSCAYKTRRGPAARLFGDAVKMFEAIGSVGPTETLAAAAERVLGPQYEVEPAPAGGAADD